MQYSCFILIGPLRHFTWPEWSPQKLPHDRFEVASNLHGDTNHTIAINERKKDEKSKSRKMSSPPPASPNPLKRPPLSSSTSQQLGPKRSRLQHPLRQTSFASTVDSDLRGINTAATPSDAGSVTGSFTGSVGGTSSVDGVFAAKLNRGKRGRKSKGEKEREREDYPGKTGGSGSGRARMGSADDGSIVAGGRGAAGADDADVAEDEDDFDEAEGELLGGDERGVTDTEAEKKNLAYVSGFFLPFFFFFSLY